MYRYIKGSGSLASTKALKRCKLDHVAFIVKGSKVLTPKVPDGGFLDLLLFGTVYLKVSGSYWDSAGTALLTQNWCSGATPYATTPASGNNSSTCEEQITCYGGRRMYHKTHRAAQRGAAYGATCGIRLDK